MVKPAIKEIILDPEDFNADETNKSNCLGFIGNNTRPSNYHLRSKQRAMEKVDESNHTPISLRSSSGIFTTKQSNNLYAIGMSLDRYQKSLHQFASLAKDQSTLTPKLLYEASTTTYDKITSTKEEKGQHTPKP
jgi:hypothetical protein